MRNFFRTSLTSIFLMVFANIFGQATIEIEAFNFKSSPAKDTIVSFPEGNDQYEKIIMEYTMRCKNGLVSTTSDRNKGCGEWDYSCNTSIIDSSRMDSVKVTSPSHIIYNYPDAIFPFVKEATYSVYRFNQKEVSGSAANETITPVTNNLVPIAHPFNDQTNSSIAYYLIKANELQNLLGAINGIQLNVEGSGTIDFLKIRLVNTNLAAIDVSLISSLPFKEVYFSNTPITSSALQKILFHTPFSLSANQGIIVELSYEKKKNDFNAMIQGEISSLGAGAYAQGTDSYLKMNGSFSMEVPPAKAGNIKDELSVGLWTKGSVGALPQNTIIFEGLDEKDNRQLLVHLPWGNSNIYFDCGNDGSGYDRINKLATVPEIEGQWNFWVFTKNSKLGTMKIYLNGVLWHSGTGLTKLINIKKLKFGSDRGNTLGYYGDVDDLTIWNKELSPDDIKDIMYAKIESSNPNFDKLLYQYNFDAFDGLNTSDNSLSAATGTFNIPPVTDAFTSNNRFKQFSLTAERPAISLMKGNYQLNIKDVLVHDSIPNKPYFVRTFYIENNDLKELPYQYLWLAGNTYVFDGVTGSIISTNFIDEDSVIYIDPLTYYYRSPMKFELLSFVTPYGIGLDFGLNGKTWQFDVSDFAPILKGKKRMRIEFGGQNQEQLDVRFLFIKGSPPRKIENINQLWRVDAVGYSSILSNNYYEPKKYQFTQNTKAAKIRCAITGHGQQGEFIPQTHYINMNGGVPEFSWQVWKECADNPVYPQGGTWIYDRAGWCPGAPTDVKEYDITQYISNNMVDVDYGLNSAEGDSRYIVNVQMVEYGNPNFVNDASIERILSPNEEVEYSRSNPSCISPKILIKNTGSAPLTSLSIEYGISGKEKSSYLWTGNLSMMQTGIVTLPTISNANWTEEGIFETTISLPNAKQDEYDNNNALSSKFRAVKRYDSSILIQMRTNAASNETSWELLDEFGTVLKARKGGLLPNKEYIDTLSNLGGCYVLKIRDTDDDGISFWANGDGNGFLSISSLGKPLTILNGDFGKGVDYQFFAGSTSGNSEISFTPEFNVFPNPFSNEFIAQIQGLTNEGVLEVYDVNGSKIFSENLQDYSKFREIKIDLSAKQSGIYIVVFQTNNRYYSRKLVKM